MKKKIVFWASLATIIDQLTKLLIKKNFRLYEKKVIIKNFFNLTYVENRGAAWGIFNGNYWFLIITTVVALAFILWFIFRMKEYKKIDIISYSMLIAGIMGNFIDRLVRGYVIDFFDFKIFKYYFPVFNIADIGIVIGVIILIVFSFREEFIKTKKKQRKKV